MTNPALFAAILANPADDAPRLAYAKWCKEKGDKDRADFIKVQCERAAKDRFDPAQEKLEKKERSLLKKHEAKWRAELPDWVKIRWFQRGFPATVHLDLETVVKRIDELVKLMPLEGIELSSGGATTESVKALAKCPQTAQLTELMLSFNEVKDAGARAIAASPYFANLKKLHLSVVNVKDAGVKALAASPHLMGVTDLRLDLKTEGLKALLTSKWKPKILTLHTAPLTGAAMNGFAKWEGLASVEELAISSCQLGPAEVKALAASPYLTNLRALDISSNPLTADGINVIGGASWLPQLVELHIQNSRLSDEVGRGILAWPPLPNMKKLIAVNNDFTYETTLALIARYGNT